MWHLYGPCNTFDDRLYVNLRLINVITFDFTSATFKMFTFQYSSIETICKHSLYPRAKFLLSIE